MIQFPEHECGLSLEHNPHKNYYQSVQQYVDDYERMGCEFEWVSETERLESIAKGELWVLQWYPNTPIGFNRLAACNLDKLLEEANK